jgi:adhesin transport system outer membrane protein
MDMSSFCCNRILLPARKMAAIWGLLTFSAALMAPAASASGAIGIADLTQATLANHPLVRSASAKSVASQTEVDAAKWQFWPTPSLGLERVQSSSSQATQGDKNIGVFRLQQPLWTGGRLTSGLDRAEARALVAQAEAEEVRQSLALRVIQAWSEAVVAIRKLEAQNESLAFHQRLHDMVMRRLNEGASAQADALLARSRIDVLTAEIQLLTTQRDSAIDRLRLLTQSSVSSQDLVLAHQKPTFTQASLIDLISRARQASPQLQKTNFAVDVARAEVGVAKSSLMPEVSLRYEHQNGNLNFADARSTNRFFLSLNSTLGAGLSSISGVNVASAQLNSALEEVAVQDQILSEQIQQDFILVQAANTRLQALQAASRASTDVLQSYERQFLAGRKQWLDLMNAAREQAQSQSQVADAMGALELSSLRLVLLSGGVDALLNVKPEPGASKAAQ